MITVTPFIRSFTLAFLPSTEYDVEGYLVHAQPGDTDFTPSDSNKINEGPETSFLYILPEGMEAGVWSLKIACYDTFGKEAGLLEWSELQTFTIPSLDPLDQAPPNTPVFTTLTSAEETGIEAAGAVDNIFIKVAWTLSPVPDDLLHFILRYKRHNEINWNELTTTSSSYKLTGLIAGVQYDFTIAAVDTWSNTSDPSGVKLITAAADTVAPAHPTAVTCIPGFGGVQVFWTNPIDADLKFVNVYRGTTDDVEDAVKIASVASTSYSDTGLCTSTTYYYWLTSEDYSGNESATFSDVVSATTIQIMVGDLAVNARVDFIVKDSIFSFNHVDLPAAASTTLTITAGSIIREGVSYLITAGSLPNANNSYVIAQLANGTATLHVESASGSSLPDLAEDEIIIALTSSTALSETNNYACYVRQSNSMMLEGAIIRDATITNAKIKDLTADKITTGTLSATSYIGVNDDQIKLGNIGTGVTGILIRNPTKTADVFKVDSTGTATLKNVLVDGNVTVGESKILLDGVNSRLTVANATGSVSDMVSVGKLATGNYGISVKDNSGLQVFKVDKDGAVLQNLTVGTLDCSQANLVNLTVGDGSAGTIKMGPNATIDWGQVIGIGRPESPIQVVLSNETHTLPADSAGANVNYLGSGTQIQVYCGATKITYDGVGVTDGTWKIASTVATGITIGSIQAVGGDVTVGDASSMSQDTALIGYEITGKSLDGIAFAVTKTQTFSKARSGVPAVDYDVEIESTNGTIFRVGQAITTLLIAHVYLHGEEVTDILPASAFRWRRVSYHADPVGDAAWNALYAQGYKSISITVDSVSQIATFHCDIIQ